jgi:hypothetical protein
MSHVTTVEVEFKDLEALEIAARKLSDCCHGRYTSYFGVDAQF